MADQDKMMLEQQSVPDNTGLNNNPFGAVTKKQIPNPESSSINE